MSKKILQEKFSNGTVIKAFLKPYDYILKIDNVNHYIKVLRVNRNSILSINSKYVWEVKTGKVSGINFKTTHKTRLDMKEFNKLSNKIIVFKNQPYKILKYINESEVIDISGTKDIFDIKIFNNIKEVIV